MTQFSGNMALCPSIRNLQAQTAGRTARKGFIYQDHVAASLCLEMIENNDLLEAWLEHQDDVTLLWSSNYDYEVEFIQVKAYDLPSRWSLAEITRRDKDGSNNKQKEGTSILEKSLLQSRCQESTCFRLVTSYDVDDVLSILKHKRDSSYRSQNAKLYSDLATKIDGKLPNLKSDNGVTARDWVERCYWDKRPDSERGIKNENLLQLERMIKHQGHFIASDQRDEIYQSLLALVRDAATDDLLTKPDAYKISQAFIRDWLTAKIYQRLVGSTKATGLISKMKAALIPNDRIDAATETRIHYLTEKYQQDFIKPSSDRFIEAEVTALLSRQVSDLDSGRIDDDGIEFHNRCLNELNALVSSDPFKRRNVPEFYVQGYMYERTNRCVHRFVRSTP